MEPQNVIAAIEQALSEILERPVSDLARDARLFEDLHLDSTSILELLMALEDSVGISIDPEELNMDNLRSVGSLADYVLAQPATSDV